MFNPESPGNKFIFEPETPDSATQVFSLLQNIISNPQYSDLVTQFLVTTAQAIDKAHEAYPTWSKKEFMALLITLATKSTNK